LTSTGGEEAVEVGLYAVTKRFGTTVAVDNVTIEICRGEFFSLLGPSGCGKTTSLRMIAGFEEPDGGRVELTGRDIVGVPPYKRNVNTVFQSYALFPHMTVAENVAFGLKRKKLSKHEIRDRVRHYLELVELPAYDDRRPSQLSGGQQQRVALARAVAVDPALILLDEPLSALDAKIRVTLRQEIRSIQRRLGITTIFVTHDQEEALSISDRIVVMSKGYIEQVGTPLDIYNAPQTQFVASFVGTLNVLTAEVTNPQDKRIRVDGQEIQVETLPVDSPQQHWHAQQAGAVHRVDLLIQALEKRRFNRDFLRAAIGELLLGVAVGSRAELGRDPLHGRELLTRAFLDV